MAHDLVALLGSAPIGTRLAANGATGTAPSPPPPRRRARSRSFERTRSVGRQDNASPRRGNGYSGAGAPYRGEAGYSRRPPPPPPPSSYSAPMTRIVGPVKDRLKQLYDQDVIREGDLDVRALEDLSLLTEEEGLVALDELAKVDLAKIRNVSAFFVGICKRTVRKQFSGQRGPRGYGRGDYGSYYDDYGYQDYGRRGGPPNYRHDMDNYGSRDSYYGSAYDAPPSVYQRMDYHILQGKQRDRGRDRGYDQRDDFRFRRDHRDYRDRGGGRDRVDEYDRAILDDSRYNSYRPPPAPHYDDSRYGGRSRGAADNAGGEREHHHSSYYDDRAAYDSPPRYHR
eukprot:TRINITY_DN14022_c0_g1_i4.p2 TRINITY_DN14022_c0_g1~~TRINITY_DN14022_c0_g1_i4.p2  ORF type:complete len:340 (+),score=56.33 TRINITY_DN14022_c0_g1_i4:184-1203(+)